MYNKWWPVTKNCRKLCFVTRNEDLNESTTDKSYHVFESRKKDFNLGGES